MTIRNRIVYGKLIFNLFCILVLTHDTVGQTAWRTQAQVVSGFVEYENQHDEGIQLYDLEQDSTFVLGKGFSFHVEATTATLTDQEGNLRAFSNGCAIFRGDFSLMPGGEILNPGNVYDMSCPKAGYIAEQGAFFIDKPGAPGKFYLIHAGLDHTSDKFLHVQRIAWSVIDFSEDSAGVVVQSNQLLLEGDLEAATATRHGNGRDWWLIVPLRYSAEVRLYLISPSGIEFVGSQWLAEYANKDESRWAFLGHCFSPNGQYWARYNTNTGMYIYHFDRCSGQLEDLSRVTFPIQNEFGGGGILFSMNSQFLYFTHQRLLYRVDIEQTPTQLDTVHTISGGTGGTFHRMFAGPEGNILISPMARATHWHVIENTDAKDVTQVVLKLRAKTLPCFSVRSVPHVINLQLGQLSESICDTLSVSISNPNHHHDALAFRLFPNPATDRVRLELASPNTHNKPIQVQLFSMQGSLIYEGQLPPWAYIHEIPIHACPAGIYIVKLSDTIRNTTQVRQVLVE